RQPATPAHSHLSLHDALPISAGEGATLVAGLVMIVVTMLGQTAPTAIRAALWLLPAAASVMGLALAPTLAEAVVFALTPLAMTADRKSTRLNSSHVKISYAVF